MPPAAAPAGRCVAQVARETWEWFFHKLWDDDVDKDVNRSYKTTWAPSFKAAYWGVFKSLELVQCFSERHIRCQHLFVHISYYVM